VRFGGLALVVIVPLVLDVEIRCADLVNRVSSLRVEVLERELIESDVLGLAVGKVDLAGVG
jgi:hypothetical protein